ncbi:MAG: hypothetical protein QM485_15240 [Flavobacteriaceae bacterium]
MPSPLRLNSLFSRINYQVGEDSANFDPSLEHVQHATGIRLIEDQNCKDELFGDFGYLYGVLGEK